MFWLCCLTVESSSGPQRKWDWNHLWAERIKGQQVTVGKGIIHFVFAEAAQGGQFLICKIISLESTHNSYHLKFEAMFWTVLYRDAFSVHFFFVFFISLSLHALNQTSGGQLFDCKRYFQNRNECVMFLRGKFKWYQKIVTVVTSQDLFDLK